MNAVGAGEGRVFSLHRRARCACLVCCGLILFAAGGVSAEEKLPLIPEDISLWDASLLWDKQFLVRGGFGYKDNVLLSPFQPLSSPFFKSALEASVFRLPADGFSFTFLLEGEDTRYFRNVGVNAEQMLLAVAQVKKEFARDWQAGAAVQYYYQDQVQDVSVTESELARARVQGNSLTLRPSLRRYLGTNWWGQLEFPVSRQWLSSPLDDYWQAGPKLILTREYGRYSEVRLSYGFAEIRYDTREGTDAQGFSVPGTRLKRWAHKLELAWQHDWDAQRHWRTITALAYERNLDNAAGYFDFHRYGVAEQLRYQAATWELQAKLDFSYYDFPVRTISTSDTIRFHRQNLILGFRAEKRFAKHLKIFGEYEYERSLSNEPFEQYSVNTGLGGVEWEF